MRTKATPRDDAKYMDWALALARKGAGTVSPNPMVGAVLVSPASGGIVGEGAHGRAGGPHAEIVALERAGAEAKGATLYVNLEPCAHEGRTPPCTEALARAGVSRVVAAMADPNPAVSGKGFQKLRDAGIDVDAGLRGAEAKRLNEVFTKFITTGFPFVTLKLGMSLDGRIADAKGASRWVTSEESRKRVHEMRYASDALLAGAATVAQDNPLLTVRLDDDRAKPLLRVVLDPGLELPPTLRLWDTLPEGKILLAAAEGASLEARASLERRGVEVLEMGTGEPAGQGKIPLRALLEALGKRDVTSVLVEGGARLATALAEENLVDKIVLFVSPRLLGAKGRPAFADGDAWTLADAPRFRLESVERIGADVMLELYPEDAR
ncbi:MAG: bifunctional diaminohydroxyphosphoribosylaminopyrimidine deaminase/5-amino-6-(5-phosphoribosylamino)uracil reductase RibD [Acidobacteriota bacterium]|nr:MAG: bifunctional diaminohydroxyphosphoribosylaminopyrimidine deaminase/5-amino-6-(5-phosphoribosylamino)uracil reductase RibD [Acidobacteriota bacterium]